MGACEKKFPNVISKTKAIGRWSRPTRRAIGRLQPTKGTRHDGRMSERKEQSNRHRPLAFLHQLTCYVVDSGNVVGIEGVA